MAAIQPMRPNKPTTSTSALEVPRLSAERQCWAQSGRLGRALETHPVSPSPSPVTAPAQALCAPVWARPAEAERKNSTGALDNDISFATYCMYDISFIRYVDFNEVPMSSASPPFEHAGDYAPEGDRAGPWRRRHGFGPPLPIKLLAVAGAFWVAPPLGFAALGFWAWRAWKHNGGPGHWRPQRPLARFRRARAFALRMAAPVDRQLRSRRASARDPARDPGGGRRLFRFRAPAA